MKGMEQEMAENGRPLLSLIAQVFVMKIPFISHSTQLAALEQIHTRSAARHFSSSGSAKETPPHL